jgi:2-polyprenyl-3-methyl-5-hydroxy-6-metoxy-1,4-benzoquinol methylase
MKWTPLDPPRVFETGRGEPIRMKDCGRVTLESNEQVTFVTESGAEYDVARKSWGFYATPSLNGRLLNFGLRAALVRSHVGKYYLFLVERGRETELQSYLDLEQNRVVRWLDNDDDLRAVEANKTVVRTPLPLECPCGGNRFVTAHMYFAPPAGEVRFAHVGNEYRREIFRCSLCGHFISVHTMENASFYGGAYVDSTYGDEIGMRRAFERIVSLPPEKSDNHGRVRRLLAFAETHFGPGPGTVLDVGSGLCVFLHAMKRAGWTCTALDPDPRAAKHAREVVGVEAITADWFEAPGLDRYDVITFNKVLEHVKEPAVMLRKAAAHLAPGGFIYIELPDGEAAAPPHGEGFGREEFFIEHWHIFSLASVSLLAGRGGFHAIAIERLREPSTKYTIRAFLVPRGASTDLSPELSRHRSSA